jgi:hypothetical protein
MLVSSLLMSQRRSPPSLRLGHEEFGFGTGVGGPEMRRSAVQVDVVVS